MKKKTTVIHLWTPRNLQIVHHLLRATQSKLMTHMLCTCALLWSFFALANDNTSQLKNIQQDIAAKEKQVQQQKQQRRTLLDQLQSQEKAIAHASRQLRETRSTLGSLDKDIRSLTASIKTRQQQQQQQESGLAQQLDAAFRQGQRSGLQLLLSGEESQRSERILAYFSYLNEAREKSIIELKHTRSDLAKQKAALVGKQSQQTSLLNQQQTQQQKLENTRQARQQTLTALESSLEKDQARLTELRQNESRLRGKIAKAEREAKARAEREAREAQKVRERTAQAKRQGTTYKPTEHERALVSRTGGLGRAAGQAQWPVRGAIEHRFGEPLQGELRWKGLVITAPEGAEVKAIADGRVLMADWLQGYGLVVVVEHGKGDMSLYGYNQSALVSVGTQVRAGQSIALVGNSGGRGTPSLYFEIRRQGQAVNPLPWLGR